MSLVSRTTSTRRSTEHDETPEDTEGDSQFGRGFLQQLFHRVWLGCGVPCQTVQYCIDAVQVAPHLTANTHHVKVGVIFGLILQKDLI